MTEAKSPNAAPTSNRFYLLRRVACAAAAAAFFGLCLASFVQAFRVPIYTDEINWKTQQYRYWQTGFRSFYNFVQCPSQFDLDLPWALKPAALALSGYWAATYQWAPPVLYRILGHLGFALGCFLFAALIRAGRRSQNGERGLLIPAFFALLPTSFALLPWIATLNRPEQEFWIGATALALMVVYRDRLARVSDAAKALGLVVAVAIGLQIHPQLIFLFPLFALAVWYGIRAWAWRGFAVGGFAFFGAVQANYWSARIKCPENAIAAATFSIEHTRWPSWDQFVELTLNLERQGPFHEFNIVGPSGFGEWTQSYWLAPYPLAHEHLALNQAIAHWLFALFALATVGAVAAGIVALKEAVAKRRMPDPWLVLTVAMFGVAFGFFMLLPNRNFYRGAIFAQLWFAVAAMAFVAFARSPRPWARLFCGAAIALFATGGALSIVSQIALYDRSRDTLEPLGDDAFLVRQPHSFNPLRFGPAADRIVASAKACGWDEAKTYRYVLSDELGHQAIRNVRNPIFNVYVSEWRFAGGDPVAMMKRVGIEGIVGDCRIFGALPQIWPALREVGGVCCAGFSDGAFLDRLPKQ